MAGVFLSLCAACATAALSVLLADPRWAKDHAWLALWLWIAAGAFLLFALVAWLKRIKKTMKHRKQSIQKTVGHSSPNIITGDGSTVNFNTQSEATAEQKRPYVRPLEYSHVDMGEQIYSGYREFLKVANDGEGAYDIRVADLEIGHWRVQFEPLSILKGQGRIMVARISRTKYVNGSPHSDTWQQLDGAWKDALTMHPALEKAELQIHYRDYRERPFLSTCSIRREINQRGITVFLLDDREDVPVLPTRGSGMYAT